jgi:hypothetical protein
VSKSYSQGSKIKRGDGQPEQRDHVRDDLTLTLEFSSVQAAHDFAAAAEANLVLRMKVFGGTFEDETIKNVKGDGSTVRVPTLQDQGIAGATITARATFGPGDTLATMITSAAV